MERKVYNEVEVYYHELSQIHNRISDKRTRRVNNVTTTIAAIRQYPEPVQPSTHTIKINAVILCCHLLSITADTYTPRL
jgi:hypothetical protein